MQELEVRTASKDIWRFLHQDAVRMPVYVCECSSEMECSISSAVSGELTAVSIAL